MKKDSETFARFIKTKLASLAYRVVLKKAKRQRLRPELKKRFCELEKTAEESVGQAIREIYFARKVWGDVDHDSDLWAASAEGKKDFGDHLYGRLHGFRTLVIPWLDSCNRLDGSRVLEIGAGTGASTVALCEQGARVTAVDVDQPSIQVAKIRCEAYGFKPEFEVRNAVDVLRNSDSKFDWIIYFACIEHMTHAERIESLECAWQRLAKGGCLAIVEAPNRLWPFDSHTSRLPFYHWLPNDLAYVYSKFSPREPFNAAFRDPEESQMMEFLRHGRGMSYHEIEVAIGRVTDLIFKQDLASFLRESKPIRLIDFFQDSFEDQAKKLLRSQSPQIPAGFFEPHIDVIIEKPL